MPQSAAECGGARPEDNTKPNQDEVEPEPEDEAEPRARACGPAAVAVAAKVGELSPKSRAELDGFVRDMGEACVLRALDIAQDAGKMTWRYVRGILRQKQAQGVACLEDIFCEKASHKGIIIGKHGDMLKKISSMARIDCEKFMGTKVYLTTWVKVKENWRDSDFLVRNFGYNDQ